MYVLLKPHTYTLTSLHHFFVHTNSGRSNGATLLRFTNCPGIQRNTTIRCTQIYKRRAGTPKVGWPAHRRTLTNQHMPQQHNTHTHTHKNTRTHTHIHTHTHTHTDPCFEHSNDERMCTKLTTSPKQQKTAFDIASTKHDTSRSCKRERL